MIDIVLWRCRVGTFIPKQKCAKTHVSVLVLGLGRNCVVGVFLLSLLLLCGDVESNPGPPKQSRSKQPTLSINGSIRTPTTPSQSEQPDNTTILNAIETLGTRFDTFVQTVEKVEIAVSDLTKTTQQAQVKIDKLLEDNTALQTENRELRTKMNDLETKLDDLEGRSRRNNLIFHGLAKRSGQGRETWEDCENLVKKTLSDKLGLDTTEIKIDRAHRIKNANDTGPIIVRFEHYKDKENIFRERRKLKDTSVYINEDFTSRVRDIRKKLFTFVARFREEGKRANLSHDHLIVDGEKFLFDPTSNTVHPARQSRQRQTQHRPSRAQIADGYGGGEAPSPSHTDNALALPAAGCQQGEQTLTARTRSR